MLKFQRWNRVFLSFLAPQNSFPNLSTVRFQHPNHWTPVKPLETVYPRLATTRLTFLCRHVGRIVGVNEIAVVSRGLSTKLSGVRWSFSKEAQTLGQPFERAKHARTDSARYLFHSPFSVCPVPFDQHISVPSRCWTTVAGSASIITALRFAAAPRAPRLCIYADLSCALPAREQRVTCVRTRVKNLNIQRRYFLTRAMRTTSGSSRVLPRNFSFIAVDDDG